MEFELDDYRTGKIKQKRRNLSCVKEPQNYCKNNNYKKNEKSKNENCITNNCNSNSNSNVNFGEKPIYVNSNYNYLIAKLKKENENLRLKLVKYENHNRFKPIENKIKQKKMENTAVRLTKKMLNNKQLITKSSHNLSNFANYTYTNKFYNPKVNKYKTNNNSSLYNNYNKNYFNTNAMTTSSFFIRDKKNLRNNMAKSLSVFRSTSKNKPKNAKRIIYDKIRTNYKKIQNSLSNTNITNIIEIRLKGKNEEKCFKNLNTNHSHIHTLSSNIYNNLQKNIFSWKKKFEKDKDKMININHNNSNLCNTDRKKTEVNVSNSNSKERNSHNIFLTNNEFNLTWSKFPKKSIETSFDRYYMMGGEKSKHEIILNSKNRKNNYVNLNSSNNKISTKKNSKNKQSDKGIINEIRKDITPHKITINRRMIDNKNKNSNGNSNMSMKNIINIRQKKNNNNNNIIIKDSIINTSEINKKNSCSNILHQGDIYVHKKKISGLGIDNKNNNNVSSKYNVTINNINNCNYINLIQAPNKPELKIIKKK